MNKDALKVILGAGALVGGMVFLTRSTTGRCMLKPQCVRVRRVLVLGDSLTGTPTYCATLKQMLPDREIRCEYIEGAGIAEIKNHGLRLLDSYDADAVVFLAGVNDLASGRPFEYITRELDHTYRSFAVRDVKVIAVTLTPWSRSEKGAKLQPETEAVNAYIRQHPIPRAIVDTREVNGQDEKGLHLTQQGGIQLGLTVGKHLAGMVLTRD